MNISCLAGFTLTEAYLIGAVASYSSSDAVILAVGGTVRAPAGAGAGEWKRGGLGRPAGYDDPPPIIEQVLLIAGLTLFAWQVRIDFTALTSVLFVLLWTVRRQGSGGLNPAHSKHVCVLGSPASPHLAPVQLIFFAIVVAIAPTLIFRTLYASLGVLVGGAAHPSNLSAWQNIFHFVYSSSS